MAKIVFYQSKGAGELRKWIDLHVEDSDIIFERDSHFHKGNRRTYEDYLDERDIYEIDARAFRISERWYRDFSGRDRTIYEGVSLGNAVEYKIMKSIIALFREATLLEKLREREAPDTFVFVDDGSIFSKLLKDFSACYGIGIEPLPFKGFFCEGRATRFSVRENIKIFVWHILDFLKRLRLKRRSIPRRIVLVEGYGKFTLLIKRLAERGDRVIVMGRAGFEKGLFHPNISYHSWSRFKPGHLPRPEIISEWLPSREEISDLIRRDKYSSESFDISILVLEELKKVIIQDFPGIMSCVVKIKKFLKARRVGAIITLQDRSGINRILALCGNALGIDTIEIQHGVLSDIPYPILPVSHKLFIWGDAAKEFYLKRNIEEKRLYVVGDPRLENLKKVSINRIARLKNSLGLKRNSPVVFFASQPFITITSLDSPLNTVDLFERICRTASRLSEVDFLIKFHPSEDSSLKREILRRYTSSRNIFVAEGGVVEEFLSLSHVLITFCSSIVLEASILGVPIIIVNFTRRRDLIPIVDMGGAVGVYQENEFIPSLKSVLYDDEIKRKIIMGQRKFVEFQLARGTGLKRMEEAMELSF